MNFSRRNLLKAALGMSLPAWLTNYRAMAAPYTGQVKITKIKTMGLDNVGDGCLIRVETDAGLVGYGEAGLPSAAARARVDMMAPQLIGQDPLAIERHFYMMSTTQYSFMANIPTVSGVDIALWDLAGKITGYPVYRLLGGPIRKNIPVYSHGGPADMLDKAQCKAWADEVKAAPQGFKAFKFGFGPRPAGGRGGQGGGGGGRANGAYNPTLSGADLLKVAKGYVNLREALGDEVDIGLHCTGQFDTPSSIGLCKAIEPINPWLIEDPLTVRYSEAWLHLKRSTRVPLFAGEKVELVEGFRPYLDNQVLEMIHPDIAYSGGITGCRKIADYAALTRTPMGMHSGPCSLIRFYASMHMGAATQNFSRWKMLWAPSAATRRRWRRARNRRFATAYFQYRRGQGLAWI
jgi:L-alanine-DL-glutamate epimerase-like enolase superfamily enzyme